LKLRKALMQYFKSSSFVGENTGNKPSEENHLDSDTLNLFTIPFKKKDENPRAQHESYISALWKLRDQVTLSPPVHAHTHSHTLIHTCTQIMLHL
jgi:protein SMG9